MALLGVEGPLSQRLVDSLGHTEVNDLRNGLILLLGDQDIGWFYIPVDYPLLVGVLHGLTNLQKQTKAVFDCKLVMVTKLGDG